MTTHRIEIEVVRPTAGRPTGNSETRYRVIHESVELGVWRVPECSAARWLIEHNHAERGDRLEIYRRETLCMSGAIGWFADRTVREDGGDGTPRLVKFQPWKGVGEPVEHDLP